MQKEKIDICFDSFTTESIAVRFEINLARTVACSKSEINSDNVEVVEALKEGNCSSVPSAIFGDCYFISLDFNHVIYEHCSREQKVAHELPRLAKFSHLGCWIDTVPSAIIPFLASNAIILINE
ncbi:hypothetical protein ZWY2020_008257 [Hordeum vulgare]|nr:hypothetical protein ZWY2020_008257 [Hordeum vulgare]